MCPCSNALDVSTERLNRGKEFGAWETVNPRSNDPVGAIKDLTHGGADFTLDTSSQPEGRIAAVGSAKVWGTGAFCGERKVDVERLFTHRWKLDQAEEAYRLFDTQTTGKGVFLM